MVGWVGVVGGGLFGCFYYGFARYLVGFVFVFVFFFWVFGSGGQWWHGRHGGNDWVVWFFLMGLLDFWLVFFGFYFF